VNVYFDWRGEREEGRHLPVRRREEREEGMGERGGEELMTREKQEEDEGR